MSHSRADIAAEVTSKVVKAETDLGRARTRLGDAAVSNDYKVLAGLVDEVAQAQGYMDTLVQYSQALRLTKDYQPRYHPQEALWTLFSNAIVLGDDDKWSGRTNDAQRSYGDGKRRAYDTLRWIIDEG